MTIILSEYIFQTIWPFGLFEVFSSQFGQYNICKQTNFQKFQLFSCFSSLYVPGYRPRTVHTMKRGGARERARGKEVIYIQQMDSIHVAFIQTYLSK